MRVWRRQNQKLRFYLVFSSLTNYNETAKYDNSWYDGSALHRTDSQWLSNCDTRQDKAAAYIVYATILYAFVYTTSQVLKIRHSVGQNKTLGPVRWLGGSRRTTNC
jgi:hypothetical protein